MEDIFDAATNGNVRRIKDLLSEGVDINSKDNGGLSALMLSSADSNTTSNIETVKFLLKNGADPNLQDNDGWTALMLSSGYSDTDSNIETVKLLLENGADPNLQDNDGLTALILSSRSINTYSSIETVKLLLENGANSFIKSNYNKYPIDYCPTKECKYLISEYMWKSINQNIKRTSTQYSKSGDFPLPKDVWELILLRKKQGQLCKTLSSEKNKEVLYYFALSLELPINRDMTKRQLCTRISEQLVFGKYFNPEAQKFTQARVEKVRNTITDLAKRLGINPNQPVENIMDELINIYNINI